MGFDNGRTWAVDPGEISSTMRPGLKIQILLKKEPHQGKFGMLVEKDEHTKMWVVSIHPSGQRIFLRPNDLKMVPGRLEIPGDDEGEPATEIETSSSTHSAKKKKK